MSRWGDELGSVGYRSPALVGDLLERVGSSPDGVAWLDLVSSSGDFWGPVWKWSTIESTVRDLVRLGAVEVRGRSGSARRPDCRRVRLSMLGRAWLAGVVLVTPESALGDEPEPEPELDGAA